MLAPVDVEPLRAPVGPVAVGQRRQLRRPGLVSRGLVGVVLTQTSLPGERRAVLPDQA